jgi:hypothetical protein
MNVRLDLPEDLAVEAVGTHIPSLVVTEQEPLRACSSIRLTIQRAFIIHSTLVVRKAHPLSTSKPRMELDRGIAPKPESFEILFKSKAEIIVFR